MVPGIDPRDSSSGGAVYPYEPPGGQSVRANGGGRPVRRSISSIHGTRSGSAPGRMIDRILRTLMISMAENPTDHQSMQYDIRSTERPFDTEPLFKVGRTFCRTSVLDRVVGAGAGGGGFAEDFAIQG